LRADALNGARGHLIIPWVPGRRLNGARAEPQPRTLFVSPTPFDVDSIKLRIAELQLEHRGLNQMIERMAQEPDSDQLLMRRLKKRKLQIKDSIVLLQMQLTPDVPA
jgi:hypothetical protein